MTDPDIAEAKRVMRSEMRLIRATLPDRADRSSRIWAGALRLCDRAAASTGRAEPLRVMAFHGVGSEPDTAVLYGLLAASGYTMLLPRVEGEHIVAVVHRAGDEMQTGAHGIPAPIGPAVSPLAIDVVLVPGLAFTRDGRRLGQGGGYYDRFLALLREDCVTCGVGFAGQVVDDLPSERHDRLLTALITEADPPG